MLHTKFNSDCQAVPIVRPVACSNLFHRESHFLHFSGNLLSFDYLSFFSSFDKTLLHVCIQNVLPIAVTFQAVPIFTSLLTAKSSNLSYLKQSVEDTFLQGKRSFL